MQHTTPIHLPDPLVQQFARAIADRSGCLTLSVESSTYITTVRIHTHTRPKGAAPMPAFLSALLQSRKFWLALVAAISAIVVFVGGGITADQLVDAILVLVGVVVAGIAVEDAAEKFGLRERP